MRSILTPLLLAVLPLAPAAAEAATSAPGTEPRAEASATRFVSPALALAEQSARASYGPFRVIDDATAALVDVTDERSPAAFRAMLRAYPHIDTLAFIDCPGTYDDRANLALGRLIRAAGLAAWVPEGGSVRSGAVELLLAGVSLRIEDGTEFAVHAWLDDDGHQAGDYPADSSRNRKYLAYYREMGMNAETAAAFYAMTNSVQFDEARWLDGAEMRGWIGGGAAAEPRLAYLDLGTSLN